MVADKADIKLCDGSVTILDSNEKNTCENTQSLLEYSFFSNQFPLDGWGTTRLNKLSPRPIQQSQGVTQVTDARRMEIWGGLCLRLDE